MGYLKLLKPEVDRIWDLLGNDPNLDTSEMLSSALTPVLKQPQQVTLVNSFEATSSDVELVEFLERLINHDGHVVSATGSMYAIHDEPSPLKHICNTSSEEREIHRAKKLALEALKNFVEAVKVAGDERLAKEFANSLIGMMFSTGSGNKDYVTFTAITQTASYLTTSFMMNYEFLMDNFRFRSFTDIIQFVADSREQAAKLNVTPLLSKILSAEAVPSTDVLLWRLITKVVSRKRDYPNIIARTRSYIDSLSDIEKKLLWLRGNAVKFYQNKVVTSVIIALKDWMPGNCNFAVVKKTAEDCETKRLSMELADIFCNVVAPIQFNHKYFDNFRYAISEKRRYVLHADTDSNMLYSGLIFMINRTLKELGNPEITFESDDFEKVLNVSIFLETSLIEPFCDAFLAKLGVPKDRRWYVDAKFEYSYKSFMVGMVSKRHLSFTLTQNGFRKRKLSVSGFDVVKAGSAPVVSKTCERLLADTMQNGPNREKTLAAIDELKEYIRDTIYNKRLPTFFSVMKVKPGESYKDGGKSIYSVKAATFWNDVLDNGDSPLQNMSSAYVSPLLITDEAIAQFQELKDCLSGEDLECWHRVNASIKGKPRPTWSAFPSNENSRIPYAVIPFINFNHVIDGVIKLVLPVLLSNDVGANRIVPIEKNVRVA